MIDGQSAFKTLGCLGTIFAALVVGAFALLAWPGIERSQAEQARAQSSAEWARVAAIEANTARDREANVHREQMFQMWTVALAQAADSHVGAVVVLAAVLGALAALGVVRWLAKTEFF